MGKREGRPRRFYRVVSGCRRCGPLRFHHGSDETEDLARQGFDEALFLTGIADRSPGGVQARRKRRIGHDTAGPNGVDKVVFADDALPAADQEIEQVEYLWCDGDDVRRSMQLAPISVKYLLLEERAQDAKHVSDL